MSSVHWVPATAATEPEPDGLPWVVVTVAERVPGRTLSRRDPVEDVMRTVAVVDGDPTVAVDAMLGRVANAVAAAGYTVLSCVAARLAP